MFLQIQVTEDSLQQAPVEKMLSVWQLILNSGPGGIIILLILLILSIISVYVFVERYLSIKKASKEDPLFMNQIKDLIFENKIESAKALCEKTDTPIARMIEKGISKIGKPLNDISAAIENIGELELYKLEKNIVTLATIAGAAPMIGFLGTVIGMIIAFHKMASAGGNIDVEMLAEGIYTAMLTTVGGLIVGILAYIGYNILVNKIEGIVHRMEAKSTEFLDILQTPVK